jgi:hypothetical protein
MEMVRHKSETKDPILLSMVLVQRMGTTYSGAANDDPLTPNMTRDKVYLLTSSFKTLDYTTAGRTRVHLDKNYPVK